MKALILEGFTTKTGKILKVGDVIEAEDEQVIFRLVERGRARALPPEANEKAPKNDPEAVGQATTPPKEGAPLPAQFSAGQRVRFSHKTALNILEGVVLESKWHGPVIGWWYRIEAGGLKIWTSESHVQAEPGGSGPTNEGDNHEAHHSSGGSK